MKLTTRTERETMAFGRKLARRLKPGDIICLSGTLGAGKTVIVKGIAQGLGVAVEDVGSPTFVLLRQYKGRLTVNHLDLYRLDEARQLAAVGYEDYLYGDAVAAIEWAERLGGLAPEECLQIEIAIRGGTSVRLLSLRAKGRRYEELLKGLKR